MAILRVETRALFLATKSFNSAFLAVVFYRLIQAVASSLRKLDKIDHNLQRNDLTLDSPYDKLN